MASDSPEKDGGGQRKDARAHGSLGGEVCKALITRMARRAFILLFVAALALVQGAAGDGDRNVSLGEFIRVRSVDKGLTTSNSSTPACTRFQRQPETRAYIKGGLIQEESGIVSRWVLSIRA